MPDPNQRYVNPDLFAPIDGAVDYEAICSGANATLEAVGRMAGHRPEPDAYRYGLYGRLHVIGEDKPAEPPRSELLDLLATSDEAKAIRAGMKR